jgi:hypothetical protein
MKSSVKPHSESKGAFGYFCRDAAIFFPYALAVYVAILSYLHSELGKDSRISLPGTHIAMLCLFIAAMMGYRSDTSRVRKTFQAAISNFAAVFRRVVNQLAGASIARKSVAAVSVVVFIMAVRGGVRASDLAFIATVAYVSVSRRAWADIALKAGIVSLSISVVLSSLGRLSDLVWVATVAFELLTIGVVASFLETSEQVPVAR